MNSTIFKKFNNSGKPQKISVVLIDGNYKYNPSLLIQIRTLIESSIIDEYIRTGYVVIKRFKDVVLIENKMALQIKTLGIIHSIVFSEVLDELSNSQVRCC